MTGRDGGAGLAMAALDPPARRGGAGPPSSWLIVVARGHPRLMEELVAIFRQDARVRVIENRRRDRALLPRPDIRSLAPGHCHPEG